MRKGYKGMPCVYCLTREADTDDHVIARGFFPLDKRDNLPKVVACVVCNNAKSTLEHKLTAIMPFGARHADAVKTLTNVEPKLAKNKKLHTAISAGMTHSMRSINDGAWQPEITIPINHTDIERLCEFIVKGLIQHHWKINLGTEHYVRALFLNATGRQLFDPLFAGVTNAKVKHNLGDGVFSYEGVQSQSYHKFTLWKMSIYGAEVVSHKQSLVDRNSLIYGISCPRSWTATEMLMTILDKR